MKIVYLSGPMRGREGYNYETFNNSAAFLRNHGFVVLNPAENFGGVANYPRHIYMKHDFFHVLQAHEVVVLPGWQESEGARAEVLVAQECGKPVIDFLTGEPVTVEVVSHTVPKEPA
jgi:hypothetical protein